MENRTSGAEALVIPALYGTAEAVPFVQTVAALSLPTVILATYGMIAVLMSLERSFRRRKTVSNSDNCALPVMYSLHLKRPLANRSKALRQAAGVW